MKIIARSILLFAVFAAGIAFAGTPPLNVTVSNSGKASFKGTTNAQGGFATGKLGPGNYTVQFSSNSGELKGKKYAVVVAAGKKKVSAEVAGEKFANGGVAMKVDVGAGLNITGQVAADTGPLSKNGKKMVWIPPMLGSNMPGHWVEEDSAEAKASATRSNVSKDSIQKLQEHSYNPSGN
jgi:hypothetical protein